MRRTSRHDVRALLLVAGRSPVPASARLGVAASTAPGVAAGGSPSRRELQAMLRGAGTRRVPAISPAFVAFADPLAASAASTTLVLEPRRDRRTRRPALLTGAAAAVLTVVAVGALTGIVGGPAADAELELGAAVDTVVVLPDGRTVDGTRGLALPDGAIVRTGPDGRAVVGAVRLGPGDEGLVDGGHLVPTAAGRAAPAEPVTPGAGGGITPAGAADEATAAVDDAVGSGPAAEPAADVAVPPADAAPASELPAATLPAVTLPRLPSPSAPRNLPGVDPIG